MNKKCQKFDYGEAGNMKHYNQVTQCNVLSLSSCHIRFLLLSNKEINERV